MEQKAISSDLIRGHIDTIILHTLLEGDKYAQQIIDTVEEKSNKKYQLNQATLYSSLKRLENGEYVKSYWYDSDTGRRKYIKITPKGVDFVNENLSNWSYSRAIIDKLINYTEQKQQNVEEKYDKNAGIAENSQGNSAFTNDKTEHKIVFIQRGSDTPYQKQENTKKFDKNEDNQAVNQSQNDACAYGVSTSNDFYGNSASLNRLNNGESNSVGGYTASEPKKTEKKSDYIQVAKTGRNDFSEQKNDEAAKEFNFRTILSGLIQSSELENQSNKQKEELKPNVNTESAMEQAQKQVAFSETISDENIIKREMRNFGGKIDFSDVVSNAEKGGFKVRVSTKSSSKPQGKVYKNKLFFFSAFFVFALLVAEYFLLSSVMTESLLPSKYAALFLFLAAIFPIMCGIIYAKNSRKTMPKCVGTDKIVTSGIVVFNLLLITFAFNFILGVNLYDKNLLIRYLLFPCLIAIDVLLFYFVLFIFSRLPFFKVKIKK